MTKTLSKEFHYSTYSEKDEERDLAQNLNFKIVVNLSEKMQGGVLAAFDYLGRCVYSLHSYDDIELEHNIKKFKEWLDEQRDEINHLYGTLDKLAYFLKVSTI